jgi:hypothetical protein
VWGRTNPPNTWQVAAIPAELLTNAKQPQPLVLGQLAVVPGTSHLMHHERPELLTALIDAFLADPTPHPLMPIRRSASTDAPEPLTSGPFASLIGWLTR